MSALASWITSVRQGQGKFCDLDLYLYRSNVTCPCLFLICTCPLDIAWWRHQMEPFSALLALCAGNSPVPVNSPHKGQWCGALMFLLDLCLNKRLSKQPWGRWFETQPWSLWRHCNGTCVLLWSDTDLANIVEGYFTVTGTIITFCNITKYDIIQKHKIMCKLHGADCSFIYTMPFCICCRPT